MKLILAIALAITAALLSGCTYDDAASFGRAADAAARSYYRTGYTPIQPSAPTYQPPPTYYYP